MNRKIIKNLCVTSITLLLSVEKIREFVFTNFPLGGLRGINSPPSQSASTALHSLLLDIFYGVLQSIFFLLHSDNH